MRRLVLLGATLSVVGCSQPDQSTVRVTVRPDGVGCVVDTQHVACSDVGDHLRDTMRLPTETQVLVSVEGPARSEDRARYVAGLIRSAGYRNIATVGFITEPG